MKSNVKPSSSDSSVGRLRVLVAIASYGLKNLSLLRHVIAGWRAMPFDVHIVVLSEAPKDLGEGIDVRIGLPTENPWSLPFAHKPLFAENAERYDLFAYSEDDMEVTASHVEAFLTLTQHLEPDELAGYLRYEADTSGSWTFPDAHAHYHWKPDSTRRRGTHMVAEFTNEHAAFYLLTRGHLAKAIASGGFLRAPYEGRYDMLCSAATDPYTGCGFRKVVCISNLEAFSIHHLSNRYVNHWCMPLSMMREQIAAQIAVANGVLPPSQLLPTQSRLASFKWSKDYYEPADEDLAALIPRSARTVLSVGCGWGATEALMKQTGAQVIALPLDAVIGASAAARGIELAYGTLEEGLEHLRGRRFDAVAISNLLHLAANPEDLLVRCAPFVAPGGVLVARGPNFASIRILAKRVLSRGEHEKLRSFRESGVRPIGPQTLKGYLRDSKLRLVTIRWRHQSSAKLDRMLGRFTASDWYLQAIRESGEA